MWIMLNKMAEEKPLEYEAFVSEQLKNGKSEANPNHRTFRPSEGFSIKTKTVGGDGVKIRDISSSSQGKDFFINFCSHEAVEPPRDKNGRPFMDDIPSADSLEIPMAIGSVRITRNGSMAIDVVYHPVVLKRCMLHNLFRIQIIDLALEWVKSDCNVNYNKKYEMGVSSYYGGRGEDEDTPVLFVVDENGNPVRHDKDHAKDMDASSSAMTDTSNLLNSLKEFRDGDNTSSLTSNSVPFSDVRIYLFSNYLKSY